MTLPLGFGEVISGMGPFGILTSGDLVPLKSGLLKRRGSPLEPLLQEHISVPHLANIQYIHNNQTTLPYTYLYLWIQNY